MRPRLNLQGSSNRRIHPDELKHLEIKIKLLHHFRQITNLSGKLSHFPETYQLYQHKYHFN
jgi:hypothetical protein